MKVDQHISPLNMNYNPFVIPTNDLTSRNYKTTIVHPISPGCSYYYKKEIGVRITSLITSVYLPHCESLWKSSIDGALIEI